MSFQPQPPPAATARTRSGRGLTIAGFVTLVVGLAAGAALFFLSGYTEEETVKRFARAPAGCTTTLHFDRADTFEIYLETAGVLDEVRGDCAANGSAYNRADDDPPRASLTFVDADGRDVPLSSGTGSTYDVGGFRGQGVQRVAIPAGGTYRVTVDSDSRDFVIAIGGESDADSKLLQIAAVAAAIAGVVMGIVLMIAGNRSRPTPPAPTAGAWPAPSWGAPQP